MFLLTNLIIVVNINKGAALRLSLACGSARPDLIGALNHNSSGSSKIFNPLPLGG